MRATLQFVRERFKRFNELYFNSELSEIELKLSNAGRSLGLFTHPRKRIGTQPADGKGCSLTLSTRFDLPEEEVEDIILHEMIHCLIWHKGIRDTSPHGPAFRSKMEEINRKHGRNISVTHRSSDEQLASDRHHRNNYICVQNWRDGRRTLTVCARTFIFELHRTLSSHPQISRIEWFWSMDPWFNRYPLSRSAKVYRLEDEDFSRYFATATPCQCDGHTFRPLPGHR